MLGIHQHFEYLPSIPNFAKGIQADTFQIFIRNNRNGKRRFISSDEILEFNKSIMDAGPSAFVVHASYSMNPCTDDMLKREHYLRMIKEDLHFLRCLAGIKYYVLHPGSAVTLTHPDAMVNLVNFVNSFKAELGNTKLAIEIMAGAGTQVVSSVEDVALLYNIFYTEENIGMCLDTCHAFSADIDFSNIYKTFKNKMFVVHLNNSMTGKGSHKDRHSSVFQGQIPTEELIDFYKQIGKNIPVILETPEYALLTDFAMLQEM